jgi:hypothetical protein
MSKQKDAAESIFGRPKGMLAPKDEDEEQDKACIILETVLNLYPNWREYRITKNGKTESLAYNDAVSQHKNDVLVYFKCYPMQGLICIEAK